ncbi:caspase-7-like [Anopheles bellator]|uniref:caspase-7-like n=1 Tax=Anopheles bellator TaxID=139047 RepID=UPI002648FAF9|nr:caspase-7-like [Anopheles bellator]
MNPTATDSRPVDREIVGKSSTASGQTLAVTSSPEDPQYKMNHKYRGYAIIINNERFADMPARHGSEKDRDVIADALKSLRFKVRVFDDPDKKKLFKVLKKYAEKDHTDNDCVVLVVMTHGEDGTLYAADGTYEVEQLWNPFAGSACPTLVGKPKLVFLQMARNKPVVAAGQERRLSDAVDSREKSAIQQYSLPVMADQLVVFSTHDSLCSSLCPLEGSTFVHSLASTLKKYGQTVDLLTLLATVSAAVANYPSDPDQKKSVPYTMSTLTKCVYFRNQKAESSAPEPWDLKTLSPPKYDMNRGGLVIILNQMKFDDAELYREGSDKDRDAIEKSFFELGFRVRPHDNPSQDKVFEILKGVSEENHTDNDCLVVVVLTHGEKGTLMAADTQAPHRPPYRVARLWERFVDSACPTLRGKPKIFLIQACRGTQTDPGVLVEAPVTRSVEEKNEVYATSTAPDLLIAYSTFEGHYSYRSGEDGSWFIQSLVKTLREHGSGKDLSNLLTCVARDVATSNTSYMPGDPAKHNKKQMPVTVSTLTKAVYFCPDARS